MKYFCILHPCTTCFHIIIRVKPCTNILSYNEPVCFCFWKFYHGTVSFLFYIYIYVCFTWSWGVHHVHFIIFSFKL